MQQQSGIPHSEASYFIIYLQTVIHSFINWTVLQTALVAKNVFIAQYRI